MFELNEKVREALIKINFIERYEELSNSYSRERIPEEERLVYIDKEEVIDTIQDLGYRAKFRSGEKFYQLQEEERGGYIFGFHIVLRYGMVELIWVVKKEDEVLLGSPWGTYSKRLINSDYIIKTPVIGDYDDLENVLRTAFIMFEDFKNAFLQEDAPVTTDIPMLRDETIYKVYIVLKGNKCNHMEIKAVSKVCNINFIRAKSKLKEKKNLIIEGDAYEIRDISKMLSQYEVDFEIEPPYSYELE